MFATKELLFARVLLSLLVSVLVLPAAITMAQDGGQGVGHITKNGIDVDLRSAGRVIADEVAQHGNAGPADDPSPVPGLPVVPQVQTRGGNTQANNGSLDNIQIFSGLRPFVHFTQSETSLAAFGRNIVATYNTSANAPLIPNPSGPGLIRVHVFMAGFSTSNDGGKRWTSGFMPPVPGSIFTLGDPSVDVDRHGNFYFAGLGLDSLGRFTIQVNKSTDGGRTWSDAAVVQQDNGGDKEWLAVGPDPAQKNRDNVYVTWTSFQPSGAQIRFGRSTDGGATWTTKTIYAPGPNPNPALPQNSLQFTNPYVDAITGRLYVPFLHFSRSGVDFIRILASDDAGESFSFLSFNIPGAPDATLLPVVSAGELIDMGSGGIRLGVHAGPFLSGRFGLRQFRNVTRLTTQPTFAARNGVLYLAWSNSTSSVLGDPNSHSNILFMRSGDGGATWSAPIMVNPAVAGDVHHVLPSLAIDTDPNGVHISYYTQHADETIDVDLANSHDRGRSFPADRTLRVTSTSFALPPSVVRLGAGPTPTTNFDRDIAPGYALGEYMSVRSANGSVYVSWGDCRNTLTEPPNALNPLSGLTHSEPDVFFQEVKAQ